MALRIAVEVDDITRMSGEQGTGAEHGGEIEQAVDVEIGLVDAEARGVHRRGDVRRYMRADVRRGDNQRPWPFDALEKPYFIRDLRIGLHGCI